MVGLAVSCVLDCRVGAATAAFAAGVPFRSSRPPFVGFPVGVAAIAVVAVANAATGLIAADGFSRRPLLLLVVLVVVFRDLMGLKDSTGQYVWKLLWRLLA